MRIHWCNTLQLPVIQPCRTEWPKWPPGATVTRTKLNVLLSILHFSVVSLACSLALVFFLDSRHLNSTMKSLQNSPLRHFLWGYYVHRITLWQSQHVFHLSVQTVQFSAPLFPPEKPCRHCGLVFLSSISPLLCSFSLIYCELIFKVVLPLSLKVKFSFLSSFL